MTDRVLRILPLILLGAALSAACTALSGLPAGPAQAPLDPPAATPTLALPTAFVLPYPVLEQPVPAAPTPVPSPTAAPPPAEPPTAEPAAAPTTVYENRYAGFALDYPAGWGLVDVDEEIKMGGGPYTASLTSWQPGEGGIEGVPEGGTKLDITVIASGATDLQDAVTRHRQQMFTPGLQEEILSEETWELAGGWQALRWHLRSQFGEVVVVIAAVNGNTLILSGLGDFAVCDQIARTLRPVPSS